MNKSTELKLETIPLWINGCANVPTDQRLGDVYSPATGHVVRRVPYVGKELVNAGVRSAVAALPDWRTVSPGVILTEGVECVLRESLSVSHGATIGRQSNGAGLRIC
jgi:hypothetical protein